MADVKLLVGRLLKASRRYLPPFLRKSGGGRYSPPPPAGRVLMLSQSRHSNSSELPLEPRRLVLEISDCVLNSCFSPTVISLTAQLSLNWSPSKLFFYCFRFRRRAIVIASASASGTQPGFALDLVATSTHRCPAPRLLACLIYRSPCLIYL